MRQATCHVISALDFAWILPSLVMQILWSGKILNM
jgi:hypothetical protein